jgi:hypothetical protein
VRRRWDGNAIVVASRISSNSGIATLVWGNSSSVQIRMYLENQKSQISNEIYNFSWSTGDVFADIMPGSALAATIESRFAPPIIHVRYRDRE